MAMMKTVPFVPFPDAFRSEEVLKGTKISAQTIDLYEKPTDTLGTHFLDYKMTQKHKLLGTMNRTIHLDFYKKRLTVLGGFEGTLFEIRGNLIKNYAIDELDHFLVRIQFTTRDPPLEFWMETNEEIQQLFEGLGEFTEICARRSSSSQPAQK